MAETEVCTDTARHHGRIRPLNDAAQKVALLVGHAPRGQRGIASGHIPVGITLYPLVVEFAAGEEVIQVIEIVVAL